MAKIEDDLSRKRVDFALHIRCCILRQSSMFVLVVLLLFASLMLASLHPAIAAPSHGGAKASPSHFASMTELQKYLDRHPDLKVLNIKGCSTLKSLPALPANLEKLSVVGCIGLSSLCEELPSTLVELQVKDCPALLALPNTDKLKRLEVVNCNRYLNLSYLSTNLVMKQLILRGPYIYRVEIASRYLETIKLPDNLVFLQIERCPSMNNLQLPQSLREMVITNDPQYYLDHQDDKLVPEIPKLPKNMRRLTILGGDGWVALKKIPQLPDSLTHLEIRNCDEIDPLPALPASLVRLVVFECQNLHSMPALPKSLKQFELDRAGVLTALPPLPPGLKQLKLVNCYSLKELPKLPSSLTSLTVDYCLKLTKIPPLPKSLRQLRVVSCPALKSVPKLLKH